MEPRTLDAALVWFRRDLRADDHAALYHALRAARRVWCLFVFDTDILDPLPRADRRVEFIFASLHDLDGQLAALGEQHGHRGVRLLVRHGQASPEVTTLAAQLGVQAVYANHDDEPGSLRRDAQVRDALAARGVAWHTGKDHVVFERSEVLTQAGRPFSVFTPYKNAWLKKLDPFFLKAYPTASHADALVAPPGEVRAAMPTLADLGFEPTDLHRLPIPVGSAGARALLNDFLPRIDSYGDARDFPAMKGPSYLSVHLRFGTVSIRELAQMARGRVTPGTEGARPGAMVWLSELIWRDFYHQILHHYPRVENACFRSEYDRIEWEQGPLADELFAAWCDGRTGYPLVDAAMAQINQTGYMHNRLRMVVASFLTKDLGIDWRRGERYFALHLNDYDLAANVGGWQWAASTGLDAQPWFRIFNPVTQSERFDAEGRFIRRYLPALSKLSNKTIHAPWLASDAELQRAGIVLGREYPMPIVDHAEARNATLDRYAVVKTA